MMHSISSTPQNNPSPTVSPYERAVGAIKRASSSVGVEFSYLFNKAMQESGMDSTAKARTSSATGLFQFIEQTWLRMVKTYGDKYGLGDEAEKIAIGSSGTARIKDASTRRAILEMRNNPEISACMAAELARENRTALQREVGGKIGPTEMYLAHFLGAGGASEFLSALRSNPMAPADSVLPEAASANCGVFYDKLGQPRTLAEIYDGFAKKFGKGAPVPAASGNAAMTKTAAAQHSPAPRLIDFTPDTFGQITDSTPSPSIRTFFSSALPESSMEISSIPQFTAMLLAQMDTGYLTDGIKKTRAGYAAYGSNRT